MCSDLDNKCFIQFLFGLNVIRVYHIQKFGVKRFFLSESCLSDVIPFVSDKAIDIQQRILQSLQDKNRIEMEVFYNLNIPKKKQKQIQKLVGIDGDYKQKILRALVILMTLD